MIKLDKHSNLDFSVINISALVIKNLSISPNTRYDDLLRYVISELGERADTNFPYALNFLYLLNKITYNQQTDTFILNENT
jgi:hypothetical protein